MPKAARKNSTKSKARPREGLALIDATYQRKMAREPDLKRELKPLRHSNDVTALVALYDAYMAAADAFQAIENQPRGKGIDILSGEFGWLVSKAWTVAEQLTRMQPSDSTDQEVFVRTLFNCALDMEGDLDGAKSVLQAAMAVGTAARRPI
jgi:tellurite resistance protein